MLKYFLLLIFSGLLQAQLRETVRSGTERDAINTSRKALIQVPEIRQRVQEVGEDALKFVGANKETGSLYRTNRFLYTGKNDYEVY